MNKIILLGRTTKDIVLKSTGEISVVEATLAVNNFKGEADFFNVTAFGKTAELIAQFVKKGQQILIEGRIQNNNYEKDGKTIYKNSYIIERFYFVSSPQQKDEVNKKPEVKKQEENIDEVLDNVQEDFQIDDDDLPF